MIRWNKWTRDYTYTYLWDKGTWILIHKKSNKRNWFNWTIFWNSLYIKNSQPTELTVHGEVK